MPEGLGPVVTSAQQNMTAFIAQRTNIDRDGVDKMLSHPNVQREFKVRVGQGWDETEALEAALMEVFSGGMTRPLRLYNGMATAENVKILKAKIAGRPDRVTIEEQVPDMLALRELVKDCDDADRIGRLIAAETAGRNGTGKMRMAVVTLLTGALNRITLAQSEDGSPSVQEAAKPKATPEDLEDLQDD